MSITVDIDNIRSLSSAERLKMLDDLWTALVYGGQSVTYQDGRQIQRADIEAMIRAEKSRRSLQAEIDAETYGDTAVAVFGDPAARRTYSA